MIVSRALGILRQTGRAPEVLRCAAETPYWAGVTSVVLGFSHPTFPTVLPLRRGRPISIETLSDLRTFWQIFARRVYPVHASDLVILDVGANIGLFTLYAARQAPSAKIFAIEPFPATFERLQQTVRDHALADQVACLNLAVTASSGIHLMRDVPRPSQQRSVITLRPDLTGFEVQGTTLSELIQKCRLDRIDLLKMDIEGGEYAALLATPLHVFDTISRIALEYHGHCAPYTKQELFRHLSNAGFQITSDMQNAKGYGVAEAVKPGSPVALPRKVA